MNAIFKSYAATSGGATVDVTEANVIGLKFELVTNSVVTISTGGAPTFTIAKDWDVVFPRPTDVKLQFTAATANAKCHLVITP